MKLLHLKILVVTLSVIAVVVVIASLRERAKQSTPSTSVAVTSLPSKASTVASSTTVPNQLAKDSATTTAPTVTERDYSVGDCVMWDQATPQVEPTLVPCSQPHIFEVTGKGDMPPGRYPLQSQWTALDSVAGGQCYDLAITYLGGATYPNGRFTVASIDPLQVAWANGQNYAWCGVTIGPGTPGHWLVSRGSAEGTG